MAVLKSDKERLAKRYKQGNHHDINSYPQTEQVFEKPKLDFQNHRWVQRGPYIVDTCEGCQGQSSYIGMNKMLVKANGKYDIIKTEAYMKHINT